MPIEVKWSRHFQCRAARLAPQGRGVTRKKGFPVGFPGGSPTLPPSGSPAGISLTPRQASCQVPRQVSHRHPRSPKPAAGGRPLLVGRSPSARTTAPFGTNRSAQAPCSWGLGASTRRQRHWLAAPPPPCSWGLGASTRSRRHWPPALPAGFFRARASYSCMAVL